MFIGEDFGDEPGTWSGRWSAHWESDRGGHRQGPESVTAAEAIAWGRANAKKVLIRPGDSNVHYSAGAVNVGDNDAVWPVGKELPARGHLSHLDRSPNEPPIEWQISWSISLADGSTDEVRGRVADTLALDPGIARALPDTLDVLGTRHGAFVVFARTHVEARDIAVRALGEARRQALQTVAADTAWTAMFSDPVPIDASS